ncbi:unnamed protein product [Rangifer tarandus platyrhynchus]|uniref:Uncharacterized protein n=1 Tax=Rangifer tarandus platyrhynchus TaxID=3082113 RepID=A0ABN8ZEP2_RANTA|nr:unnamed protein product [Rangifer tarandus platyrhynchus]
MQRGREMGRGAGSWKSLRPGRRGQRLRKPVWETRDRNPAPSAVAAGTRARLCGPGSAPSPERQVYPGALAPGGEEGVPRCRGFERPSRMEVSRRDLRPGVPGLGGGSQVRFSHGFPARLPGHPAHRDVDPGGRAPHISIAHSHQVIHSGD